VEVEWDSLYSLAKAFPELNIVLESQWQKILYHNRTLYSLLQDNENVYLEISNFIGQDFITHGVSTLGAGRFVYGSFLPQNDPLACAGMLIDADISDEDKKRIACSNMRSLLEGVSL
jgi:predicted TIM-barrel fold metal-dependent hydrolase